MPKCSICLQERVRLLFRTGRLSICGNCVNTLNKTKLSAREAEENWRKIFRQGIINKKSESAQWVDGWLTKHGDSILNQKLSEPNSVVRSEELKVLRAYKCGIICLNREYLVYPKNWEFKRFKIKHLDKNKCHICGVTEESGSELHVHHIIFLSNSGTNSFRNLVTLCVHHHQVQHPHEINIAGGVPYIRAFSNQTREGKSKSTDSIVMNLPAVFCEHTYSKIRPVFEVVMNEYQLMDKTEREFFVSLIETFGRNVGRYVLRFANDEILKNSWFCKDEIDERLKNT